MLSEEKGSEGSGEGCEFVDEGEKEKGGKEGPGGETERWRNLKLGT